MVVSVAGRYGHSSLPLPDAIQEGNLGLLKAIDKFEWQRGFKFSTYATPWIEQVIRRAIPDQSMVIRLPVHQYEMRLWVVRARQRLAQDSGREPTYKELASVTLDHYLKRQLKREPTPEEQVDAFPRFLELIQRALNHHEPLSLDIEVGDYSNTPLGDLIRDPDSGNDPVVGVDRIGLSEAMEEVLSCLTPRERRVLYLRLGLEDGRERTLEEVGREFRVTRERIRQIEQKALRKLRYPSRRRLLEPWR